MTTTMTVGGVRKPTLKLKMTAVPEDASVNESVPAANTIVPTERGTMMSRKTISSSNVANLVTSKPNVATKVASRGVSLKQNTGNNADAELNDTIYVRSVIQREVWLNFANIGNNLKQQLEKILEKEIGGRCISDGYVKPHNMNVLTFSAGLVKGNKVAFSVALEVDICNPVEGMLLWVYAVSITKAGVKAELRGDRTFGDPLIVHVARDHHNENEQFNALKVGDRFKVRIIGTRVEFNDKHISVIADMVE